jgi:chromosome segregation ATPase
MECDICSRTPSSNLLFHCITCARNVLYEPRLEATRVLLEKGSLSRRIEKAVNTRPKGSEKQDKKGQDEDAVLSQAWSRELANARKVESEEKTGEIEKHILSLREEIKTAKDEISQRKAALERRRKDFESIRTSLPGQRTTVTNKLAESMRKASQSWSRANSKTADTRAFLCREAALLYRLRQKKKARGGNVVDQYSIGGLPIVDLKEINSALMASRYIWSIC